MYLPTYISTYLCIYLQAAIDSGRVSWNRAAEPACFGAYAAARDKLRSRHCEWAADGTSARCPLCLLRFGYFDRHHCRACGVLCCQHCSSKRLSLRQPPPSSSSSKGKGKGKAGSKGKGGGGDRVCDGCFNRLTTEAEARHLAVAKAQKIMAAAPPEEDLPLSPSPAPASSPAGAAAAGAGAGTESRGASFSSPLGQALPGPGDAGAEVGRAPPMHKTGSTGSLSGGQGQGQGGFSPAPPPAPALEHAASSDQLARQGQGQGQGGGGGGQASRSLGAGSAAAAAAGEVAAALGERGARLAGVAARGEALAEGASDFSRMARQLRQKQQRKAFHI
jgi:hypothetical protein